MVKCNYCIKEFRNHKSMTNHRRWHAIPIYENFRESCSNKIRISKLGGNNPNWKGDDVGLEALHDWIIYRFPKTKLCQCCKLRKPYDLANISQEYKRELSDWEWLCRKCHMNKDGRINNLKQYVNLP